MTANTVMNAAIRRMVYGEREADRGDEQPEATDAGETAEPTKPSMNDLLREQRDRRRVLVPGFTVDATGGR